MTIKIQRLVNVAMVLLSWLTLPLLGSGNIKRFLPAAILIFLVEFLHARIGKNKGGGFSIINLNPSVLGSYPLKLVHL